MARTAGGSGGIAKAPEGVDRLLDPEIVVIIGLSHKRRGHGYEVLRSLRRGGFEGTVLGVHPSGIDVEGIPVVAEVGELPTVPDVAVICTRHETIPSEVSKLAAIGCKRVVVFGSGFEETAAGEHRAELIRGQAAGDDLMMVGPNCLGVISVSNNCWLTSVDLPAGLAPGPVGVVSQSGSACILLTGCGRLGFSHVVSSGNETLTGLADYLELLIQDAATRVIGLVVEGIRDAPRALEAARAARERGIPIVALKLGRTQRGARRVRSHTGAVAGDSAAYEAFCERARITNVRDYDELIEALALLSATDRWSLSGRRTAFVGLSGGEGALISDLVDEAGLTLAEFSARTQTALEGLIPDFGTVENPLDATGALIGDAPRFASVVEAVAADGGVDCVVVFLDAPPDLGDELAEIYAALLAVLPGVARSLGKPILVLSNYAGAVQRRIEQVLEGTGIPLVRGTRTGLAALGALVAARSPSDRPAPSGEPGAGEQRLGAPPRGERWQKVLASARRGSVASPDEVDAVIRAYGLSAPKRVCVTDAGAAVAAAASIGYPVVLKTGSQAVVHKSDVGGVVTDLRSATEVGDAYSEIAQSVARHTGAPAPEVFVEEMVSGAVEAFVGSRTDPVYGPVIAAGCGGVLVELRQDVALSLLPVSERDVRRMIGKTGLARLFDGFRGRPEADEAAFVRVVLAVGEMMSDLADPSIEIDLNPVLVLPFGRGAKIVDMRVVTRTS